MFILFCFYLETEKKKWNLFNFIQIVLTKMLFVSASAEDAYGIGQTSLDMAYKNLRAVTEQTPPLIFTKCAFESGDPFKKW